MHELQPSEQAIFLTYHGSHLHNLQSICNRGLLIPHLPLNGVRSVNGPLWGPGIYTHEVADRAYWFRRAVNTILVCAAITTTDTKEEGEEEKGCVVKNSTVVLREEARVVPLFLLDFQALPEFKAGMRYGPYKHFRPGIETERDEQRAQQTRQKKGQIRSRREKSRQQQQLDRQAERRSRRLSSSQFLLCA
jgi:hypothetical protein